MTLTVAKRTFKTYHTGKDDFYFCPDGISLVPRAGIQITGDCPYEYRLILTECINKGWLQPVAHQPIQEVFLEELTK